MITVYPSNRLEDLAILLNAVLSHRKGSILSSDQILVESRGMQHWLNLQLAASQGISMNLQFPMPSRFIWELARSLLGVEQVPHQSPYKRDLLAWRIDRLLISEAVLTDPIFEPVSHYWGGNSGTQDPLKRFQLACKLADLFEQYMMFRPDWLQLWEQSQTAIDSNSTEQWQALLWRLLVAEQPWHPVNLQQQAIAAMADNAAKLPKQIYIFAINTLAPQTMAFFDALSTYSQVHLFHLNPCVEFWGELQSDKSLAKQMAKQVREAQLQSWLLQTESTETNPLLANLGQQGKEFFNLLQEIKGYEISAFELAPPPSDVRHTSTLLSQLQRDILTLNDARQSASDPAPQDDSIVISSSHSALREIQALHDYLLHQFNRDPNLTPQDVLVMCPAIEHYAPYIDAVFRRPWESSEHMSPRLPCSIADRTLLDSEPLITVFLELLQLPDSRFEITKILDYLRLPAIQQQFGFCEAELDTIEWWLKESAVHWGLDETHKQHCSGTEQRSAMYTWEWGLTRLLLGFAQGDAEFIANGLLLLPHVEGQQAILLGRLMQLLEQLQRHAAALLIPRTPSAWQHYLLELKNDFFAPLDDERDASELVTSVINGIAEYCSQANYVEQIELSVIRHYLNHHFSQPDMGNHFLTGQITFCSMVPMRSIPFKVIAILGLNDGQFPRQNIPLSFDLMANQPRRQGDRSRRGDDRYLFLEALISVRDKLYLSYQGRDIKNNAERQPSLILSELMEYLTLGYGWQCDCTSTAGLNCAEQPAVRQQPLHPFSLRCYQGELASFDPGWLRLAKAAEGRDNRITLPDLETEQHIDWLAFLANLQHNGIEKNQQPDQDPLSLPVDIDTLVRFFANPLQQFAALRLGLQLDTAEQLLDDAEPFSANGLLQYQVRAELVKQLSLGMNPDSVCQRFRLSGQLPESPLTDQLLADWSQQALLFHDARQQAGTIEPQTVQLQVKLPNKTVELSAELPYLPGAADDIGDADKPQQRLLLARPASCKARDQFRLWLLHLIACSTSAQPVLSRGLFLKYNANADEHQLQQIEFEPIATEQASSLLTQLLVLWQAGLCQPLLLHCDLGQALFGAGIEQDNSVTDDVSPPLLKSWQKALISDGFNRGLDQDHYFNWFFPNPVPLTAAICTPLATLYRPLYQHIREVKA